MRFRFFLAGLCLLLPVSAVSAFAVEDSGSDSSAVVKEDSSGGDFIVDIPEYTVDDPLPVEIVPPDEEALPDFPDTGLYSDSGLSDIGSDVPVSPLFSGCWFVSGTDSRLGTVTIYIPADIEKDSFGLDASGRLVYVGSDSFTAYLSGVLNNRLSFSAWSTGSYSDGSGSHYDTYDLSLVPSDTNLVISDSLNPSYSVSDLFPYLVLLVGGVLFLCFMKRS